MCRQTPVLVPPRPAFLVLCLRLHFRLPPAFVFAVAVADGSPLPPPEATAMYGAWAADNKGCCSGSKLGVFDWRTMSKRGPGKVFSVPSWYSSQKVTPACFCGRALSCEFVIVLEQLL